LKVEKRGLPLFGRTHITGIILENTDIHAASFQTCRNEDQKEQDAGIGQSSVSQVSIAEMSVTERSFPRAEIGQFTCEKWMWWAASNQA